MYFILNCVIKKNNCVHTLNPTKKEMKVKCYMLIEYEKKKNIYVVFVSRCVEMTIKKDKQSKGVSYINCNRKLIGGDQKYFNFKQV